MRVFLAPLLTPVVALLGSLAGAALAWAWFAGLELVAAGVSLVALAVGLTLLEAGSMLLPDRPVWSVRLMNQSLLAYVVLLAVAAAVSIVVTVALVADTNASEETKKLLSAVTTAITTVLGAVVIAGDKPDAALGEAVQAKFYAKYGRDDEKRTPAGRLWFDTATRRHFPVGSDGIEALYGEGWHDITGWGASARLARAKAIQEYMKHGNADTHGNAGGSGTNVPAGYDAGFADAEPRD